MTANGVNETAIAEVLSLVESTPQRLASFTNDFDDFRLAQSLARDEWSPLQILKSFLYQRSTDFYTASSSSSHHITFAFTCRLGERGRRITENPHRL